MGLIICKIHGECVVSFISEHHAKKIKNKKRAIASEIQIIQVLDDKKNFNGTYILDSNLIDELNINNFKIDIKSDFEKFQLMFDRLSAVCSKCIENYLTF